VSRDATTPGLDAGAQLEVRVAQAWFWDGYYVRRGVDVQHRFGADVSTVTDLDLLAFSLDQALTPHTYVGEVKSGKSNNTPKPLDRTLWVRGLRELVDAEGGEVTTAFRPSVSVREFARRIGIVIQHIDDLAAREARLAVNDVADVGSQGDTIAQLLKQVQAHSKTEPELERAYWFLRSEVWFLDAFDALKRTLGLLRQLQTRWPSDADQEGARTARWMFAEAISIMTLQLSRIAGFANSMDAASFFELAADKLSTGDLPSHAIRRLSERFDEYIAKLLAATDASAEVRATAMGAFAPTPPDYMEPLLELIYRLSMNASAASQLPRQMDAIMFERLVRRRNFNSVTKERLALDSTCERLVRLVAAFLRGQLGLPPVVDRVLTTGLATEIHATPPTQQTLFS